MSRFTRYTEKILKGVNINIKQKKEVEEEFLDHLGMLKSELINAGCPENQAELESIRKFGEAREIKKGLRNVFAHYSRLKGKELLKSILSESMQWVATIVIAVAISLVIRSFVFAVTVVKQCSMQDTLYEGQFLFEYKLGYRFSAPARGDIVIINRKPVKGVFTIFTENAKEFERKFFASEEDREKLLIKRIIGLPGDKVDISGGIVHINGRPYSETYVKGTTYPNNMKFPITIPKNKYFVMGDNREKSMDSRDLGLMNADMIEGKAVLRVWPLGKFGSISDIHAGK